MVGQPSGFGERLRRLREGAGLTQEALAERSGLTVQVIGALERGTRRHPYPHTIRALAAALELPESERAAFLRAAPRRGGVSVVPPSGDVASALPAPPTRLVGREVELAALAGLLGSAEPRLLTLTGPGGVGKTRLAIQAATDATEAFADGVVFVPLAPLADPALVVPTIGGALGLHDAAVRSARDALIAHLRQKRPLLVLDNFEHLLAAAPDVADLLAACAALKLLITSRAPLGVRAEQEFPVAPLALPDPAAAARGAASLVASPAVALFVERARAADPGFQLTDANAPAVAEVCCRIDGLPLAIELAAARVKVLSPEALRARLTDRLRLLTGGARDLPDRQRTMRNAIAWSHDLLDPDERVLFRRFAVFVGGFDLEGAEAVAGAAGTVGVDVLQGVASLVDKNLLRAERVADEDVGEPRFGMLETVRDYALERLAESGEAATVRDAHLDWCLALAERANRELWGPHHGRWPDRLAAEYDNLRAALAWALERRRIETGLGLTYALWKFIRTRGHASEARRWQELLLAAGADLPPRVRAAALWLAGDLAGLAGDYGQAAALLEESLALARGVDDRPAIAKALYLLGNVAEDLNDVEREVALYEDALALFREAGDPWWVPFTIASLGRAARKRGDYGRAKALHEEALAWQRERGNAWGVAWALTALGEVAADEGEVGRAAALFREGARLHADLGERAGVYYCLFGLGQLAAAGGRPEGTARLLGAAEALREARGLALQADHRGRHDCCVTQAQDELGGEAFAAAWAAGRALSPEQAVDEAAALAVELTAVPVTKPAPILPAGLSAREAEVLRLVARGLTNAQAAERLFLSRRTVDAHLRRVYDKLGTSSRAEAVRFALEHDLA